MIAEVERFQCSPQAEGMWRRLQNLYRFRRAGLVTDGNGGGLGWTEGDTQVLGRNWAETALCSPTGSHPDLGTEARLLFIACVGCLARLEEQGEPQSIGVALARRRLSAHGLGAVAKRFGLTWCGEVDEQKCTGCEEHDLLNITKEWLAAALGDDPYAAEQLELPWSDTVRRA